MADAAAPFRRTSAVRFSDTDAMGHVNHARFLSYLEDARVALFVDAMGVREAGGLEVILARAEVDYLRPVFYGRDVTTTLWLSHIGTKSFTFDYVLEQDGEPVARARTVMVAFDYAANSSRPLRDDETVALRAHAGAAPPGA